MPTTPTDSSEQAGVTSAAQVKCPSRAQLCSGLQLLPAEWEARSEGSDTAAGVEASPEQGDESRAGDDGSTIIRQIGGNGASPKPSQRVKIRVRSGEGEQVRHSPV